MKASTGKEIVYVMECWGNAGTEQYVYLLAKELKKKHINVHLVILGSVDCDYLDNCRSVFSEINLLSESKNSFLNKQKELVKILKASDCEVVHFHLYSNLLISVLSAKYLGKKIVSTYHIPLSIWTLRHKIAWLLSSFISNCNIAVASIIKDEFLEKKSSNVTVINPPVNMISRRVEKPDSTFRVVGVGRLSNMQKDWPTLIKPVHILKQTYKSDVKLTICGGGPDVEELNRLIHTLNLQDNCLLTGHVDKATVEQHLVASDLFVLPSKFEGFGIAPVEAMQIGLPTITANYPASQDYISHDVTGWTFPIGDEKALAKLLDGLINDESHREQIAKKGQALALDKFAPQKIAEQHNKLYSELMKIE
ncbi:MAG: glycosyltransferase family 4 protein [Psychromonas sp.]